jgi:hypothetical protein
MPGAIAEILGIRPLLNVFAAVLLRHARIEFEMPAIG